LVLAILTQKGKNRQVVAWSLRLFLALALVAVTGSSRAQSTTADRAPSSDGSPRPAPKPVPWHDSTVLWSQRATTQTLGVGDDYQSRDPYYDFTFYLRPRYYFWENERTSLSVRGQLWASVELTNSNTSTDRGEFLLEDTLVSLTLQHAFVKKGEHLTDITLSLPRLELPTSKAGFQSGKIAQLGVRAFPLHAFPLREGAPFLPRGHVALRLGYGYQFARAIVPERSTLDRLRTDLSGRSVSNDQLGGAAFAEHVGVIHALAGADLWRDVLAIEGEFGIDPAYKFALAESAPICGVVLTGCVEPATVEDPQRLSMITTLDVYLQVRSLEGALKTALGYENITAQLGPGGERRGALWSPDAKFYLKLELTPDLLLSPPSAAAARAAGRPQVAATSR
jgi:hypothetical protein